MKTWNRWSLNKENNINDHFIFPTRWPHCSLTNNHWKIQDMFRISFDDIVAIWHYLYPFNVATHKKQTTKKIHCQLSMCVINWIQFFINSIHVNPEYFTQTASSSFFYIIIINDHCCRVGYVSEYLINNPFGISMNCHNEF